MCVPLCVCVCVCVCVRVRVRVRVCVCARAGVSSKQMWVPAGAWVEWGGEASHIGPTLLAKNYSLSDIPVLVSAGAVVPLKTVTHTLTHTHSLSRSLFLSLSLSPPRSLTHSVSLSLWQMASVSALRPDPLVWAMFVPGGEARTNVSISAGKAEVKCSTN